MSRRNPEMTTPVFRLVHFQVDPDTSKRTIFDMREVVWSRRADGSPAASAVKALVVAAESLLVEGGFLEVQIVDSGRRKKISALEALLRWKEDMNDRITLTQRGRAETMEERAVRKRIDRIGSIEAVLGDWAFGLPNSARYSAWGDQVLESLEGAFSWKDR